MRTIHFSKNFCSSMKTVGATVFGGLWALEWAWHIAETNLRCVRSSGICMPNLFNHAFCQKMACSLRMDCNFKVVHVSKNDQILFAFLRCTDLLKSLNS